MDSVLLELLRENNRMLKEVLSILGRLTSKEHTENEDLKAFAINLLADIMVEYKSDELHRLVKDIKL